MVADRDGDLLPLPDPPRRQDRCHAFDRRSIAGDLHKGRYPAPGPGAEPPSADTGTQILYPAQDNRYSRMIRIIRKPTDTTEDDSTGMVMAELERMGAEYRELDTGGLDALHAGIEGDLVWVCGMRQDPAQFEILNLLALENRVVNHPDAIATCASKARTTALLKKHGVPTPETVFTSSKEIAGSFLGRQGKAVYKPLYGFDGNGIFPFTRLEELGEPPYYLQEFVPNTHDFRVFVIDGEAVGAIRRISPSFAHNIHQGGVGRPEEITPLMAEICAGAAEAIGIDYCGVDLLEKDGGYTVLEVNGTPNWHCMAAPIPRLLAEYLVAEEARYRRA
jgi:tetrahydromethanopterin:alpha-L-glutamate ligase